MPKTERPGRFLGLALTGLAVVLVASPKPGVAEDSNPVVTADGLHEVEHGTTHREFAKPGADLSVYEKVLIGPIRISYSKGHEPGVIDKKDYARLEGEFRAAIEGKVGKSHPVVDEPGPDVILLETSILDLSLKHQPHTRETIFVANQWVTIIADLRDSESHEVLYRAADRHRIADSPEVLMDAVSFWSRLGRYLENWATYLAQILDHATSQHADTPNAKK